MDTVLVRYSEIATKSKPVRYKLESVLRQRVQDRLEYEDLDFEKVSRNPGRIIVHTEEAEEAASELQDLPGVASVSPAMSCDATIESIKQASERFEIGESFGVEASRTGGHDFSSRDVEEKLGSFTEERTGAEVDLDNPDTLLEVDIRSGDAYVFTQRLQGPDGFPVGSQGELAALISGGIDSPVAAYEVMKRGCDILPIYFYNKPIAAEDHWIRFRSAVSKLEKFHPSKKWKAYRVDMERVNDDLLNIGRGRMVLHRIVMFRTAEKLAEREGLSGMVTGESIGQKSSQTLSNLEKTSSEIEKPIHRPLLTWSKNEITEKARQISTFEDAKIASACSTMAPENPAAELSERDFKDLKEEVQLQELVEKAVSESEKLEV